MSGIRTLIFTLNEKHYLVSEEKQLTMEELYRLRAEAGRQVVERTNWDYIIDGYDHIVYYTELRNKNDEIVSASVYLDNWALTDKDLNSLSKSFYVEALHRRA